MDRFDNLPAPAIQSRQLSHLSDDSLYSSPAASRYDLAAERDLANASAIGFSIKF